MDVFKYNGSIITDMDGNWLSHTPIPPVDPYNPLHLPPNTMRVRTSDGNPPIKGYEQYNYETATLVSGTTDVYDLYKSGTDFGLLLFKSYNVIEVLGANTTGITSTSNMFDDCQSLTSVALFDTSNVTDMHGMFYNTSITTVPLFDTSKVTYTANMFLGCESLTTVPLLDISKVNAMHDMFRGCTSLTSIPLFDTSSATNMNTMFLGCTKVESGALALYLRASSQPNIPYHYDTFGMCGRDTITGAAELAQIPSDWGGTGA